jgi:hypothetical protein
MELGYRGQYRDWVRAGQSKGLISKSNRVKSLQNWLWGPPSLLSNEYRSLSPGIKRPEREAGYKLPTGIEVKKTSN